MREIIKFINYHIAKITNQGVVSPYHFKAYIVGPDGPFKVADNTRQM